MIRAVARDFSGAFGWSYRRSLEVIVFGLSRPVGSDTRDAMEFVLAAKRLKGVRL